MTKPLLYKICASIALLGCVAVLASDLIGTLLVTWPAVVAWRMYHYAKSKAA